MRHLPAPLQDLTLAVCNNLTAQGLVALSALHNLQALDLSYMPIEVGAAAGARGGCRGRPGCRGCAFGARAQRVAFQGGSAWPAPQGRAPSHTRLASTVLCRAALPRPPTPSPGSWPRRAAGPPPHLCGLPPAHVPHHLQQLPSQPSAPARPAAASAPRGGRCCTGGGWVRRERCACTGRQGPAAEPGQPGRVVLRGALVRCCRAMGVCPCLCLA